MILRTEVNLGGLDEVVVERLFVNFRVPLALHLQISKYFFKYGSKQLLHFLLARFNVVDLKVANFLPFNDLAVVGVCLLQDFITVIFEFAEHLFSFEFLNGLFQNDPFFVD